MVNRLHTYTVIIVATAPLLSYTYIVSALVVPLAACTLTRTSHHWCHQLASPFRCDAEKYVLFLAGLPCPTAQPVLHDWERSMPKCVSTAAADPTARVQQVIYS